MGCCCFNTLRGAAFFVASVHIYNGLECILKYIAFPVVFSSKNYEKTDTSVVEFLPGMGYAILYFLFGCAIFRGIERESGPTIKWGAIGFAVAEVTFFILKQGLQIIPAPKVPGLSDCEQPFEMNIYKTLYYFLFTIVGGLIYICILFLYLQQLTSGHDEFSQFFNITSRMGSAPTPTTTTQPAQPAATPIPQNLASNPQNSINNPIAPNAAQHNSQSSQNAQNRHNNNNNLGSSGSKHSGKHRDRDRDRDREHRKRNAPTLAQNPIDLTPTGPPLMAPQPLAGPGLLPKDQCGSPSSPMFPYFLLRRNSKLNTSSKSDPHGPPEPPPHHQRCIIDEPPPVTTVWHQHQPRSVMPPMPPLRQDFGDGTPRSISGGSDIGPGPGRNLLSPSRLVGVNHHVGHGHVGPVGHHLVQGQGQPGHQYHSPPVIPPFYESSDERRDSFGGPVVGGPAGCGYQSPGGSHAGSGHHYQYGGRGPESLYQKIPMSPGFDYCLR